MELDAGVRRRGRADGVLALLRRPADQQPVRGSRVGLDMKDVCDRGVVERTVREAMVSDEIRGVAQAMA